MADLAFLESTARATAGGETARRRGDPVVNYFYEHYGLVDDKPSSDFVVFRKKTAD